MGSLGRWEQSAGRNLCLQGSRRVTTGAGALAKAMAAEMPAEALFIEFVKTAFGVSGLDFVHQSTLIEAQSYNFSAR